MERGRPSGADPFSKIMEKLKTILIIILRSGLVWFFADGLPRYHSVKDQLSEVEKIAAETPDTVRDTTTVSHWDTIVKVKHDTISFEKQTDSTKIYYDTLRTDNVRIWTSSLVKGQMNWNSIAYQLRQKRIKEQITINNKLPVPRVVKEEHGLYLTPQLGLSSYGAAFGVGVLWDRQGLNYSASYYRLGGKSFLTVGTALKL